MGIELKPRSVEPPALRRWLIEGCKLIVRNPLPWALFLVLCGVAVPYLAISMVGLSFFSVFAYLLLIAAAHRVDEAGRSSVGTALRRAVPVALAYAGVVALVFAVVGAAAGKAGEYWYAPERVSHSVKDIYSLSYQAFQGFGFALFIASIVTQWLPGTSPFAYHLMALAGSEWTTALRLSDEAQRLNDPAVRYLMRLPWVLVVPAALFPISPLALPLACLWAAVSYAAYRDIFLGIAEKHAVESRSKSAVSASSAQST